MKRVALFVLLSGLCGFFLFAGAEDAIAPEIAPMMTDLYSASEEPREVLFEFDEALQTSPPEPKWTYTLPVEILEDLNDLIRLVNKKNLLDDKYPPNDEIHKMVDADVRKTSKGERLVRKIASDALTL